MDQELREAWHALRCASPIYPIPYLAPEGLVLGAENSADWLDQSAAQIATAGGRPIRWYFAEPDTAAFARRLFESTGGGRDQIDIRVEPWPRSRP